MKVFSVTGGEAAIVLGQPHGGTHVPDEIFARLNPRGQGLDDTDWHINCLYDGLLPGATVVQSHIHRYVIDANRDPGGASLYPGQNTTGLCPLTDFDGQPIHLQGQQPDAAEIEARRRAFHVPYHAALQAELVRVKAIHGFVVLYDCHSIRSEIPFLFDGTLPDFNIGTNLGLTCDTEIEQIVTDTCAASDRTMVVNGRFKGGWTTRHYGQPDNGVHAIQMELAQSTYMEEQPPWTWRNDRAGEVRPILQQILETLIQWRPQ